MSFKLRFMGHLGRPQIERPASYRGFVFKVKIFGQHCELLVRDLNDSKLSVLPLNKQLFLQLEIGSSEVVCEGNGNFTDLSVPGYHAAIPLNSQEGNLQLILDSKATEAIRGKVRDLDGLANSKFDLIMQ